MLKTSKETSAIKPLPDGHALTVYAPESHGKWDITVEMGAEPWAMGGLANTRLFVRAGRDSAGPSKALIRWTSQSGSTTDSVRIYFGAGPKSVPSPSHIEIEVVFDGPERIGKAKYRLTTGAYDRARQASHLRGGFVFTYASRLTPEEFAGCYDAELLAIIRPFEDKIVIPPPKQPKTCPACGGKGVL